MWWGPILSTCFRSSRVVLISAISRYIIYLFIILAVVGGWGEGSFRDFHLTFISMKNLTTQTNVGILPTTEYIHPSELYSLLTATLSSMVIWLLHPLCSWQLSTTILSLLFWDLHCYQSASSVAASPSVSHGLERMTTRQAGVGQGTELGSQIFVY